MADPTTVRCAVCPQRFAAELAKMGKRYCSDRCKQSAKRRKRGQPAREGASTPLRWAKCEWCSAWFIKRTTRKSCSSECSAARRRHRRMTDPNRPARLAAGRRRYRETFVGVAATNPSVDHRCQECDASFTTNRYSSIRKFCSKACCQRAHHRTRRHLERAAERAGEHFTVREIAARDGWICHICQRRIPDKGSWTNEDDDPTIDHLVPLSRGGEHTRANVAIAHRLCNSRRGAAGIVQLRLIG